MNSNPSQSPTGLPAFQHATKSQLTALLGLLPLFGAWLLIFAVFSFLRPHSFPTHDNLETLARQGTITCFAALGMTCVIIGGGIDLSVGSVVALISVVVAQLLTKTNNAAVAVIGAVVVGALIGLVNGALITKLKVLPFIVTLGALLFFRGAAEGLGNNAIVSAPDSVLRGLLAKLDNGSQWQIVPIGAWLLLISAVAVSVMLTRTRFGRHIVAVGSNENAARLCGVNVVRVKLLMYVLVGVFTAFAGIMQFSRLRVGDPTGANGLELDVIAAVVIGGASLSGGQGSIAGTLLGALIMTTINDGCTQVDLPNWVQKMVTGMIIIVAVALDRFRNARSQ